ncbi:MAG TPA: carboxypeptidase regulatory-like domain-containing protein [Pyrinomonadaceae bacterium]|jgi:hypothetical protein
MTSIDASFVFKRCRSAARALAALSLVAACFVTAMSQQRMSGWQMHTYTREQQPGAPAAVSGTVIDERGAVVEGVEVTLEEASTGLKRRAMTDGEGFFVFPLLAPGSYVLRAVREGFAPVETNSFKLFAGSRSDVRILLRTGVVAATVEVEADAEEARAQEVGVGTVLESEFVINQPLNGRTLQPLFELAPGVVLTRTSFGEQGQFSANGQRANANYFTVDGASANIGVSAGASPGQAAAGTLPALTVLGSTHNLVSAEAIEEMRIQTSTYAPEFGRMPGAQVSIRTRAGTSEFRGALFYYFRHDSLAANDWFGNNRGLKKPPLVQNQFGGAVGGPVVGRRTFFFFSYEGVRLRQPQVTVTEVPSLEARQSAPARLRPLLDAFPLPNGAAFNNLFGEFSASYSDPSSVNAASLRLDHAATEKLQLFGRYNRAPSRAAQRGNALDAGSASQSLNTLSRTLFDTETLTFGASYTLSPALANDLRFNLSRARGTTSTELDDFGGAKPPPPASFLFPESFSTATAQVGMLFRGGATASFAAGRGVDNLQRQLNVSDAFYLSRGAHQLKLGADFRRLTPVYNPPAFKQTVEFDFLTSGLIGIILDDRATRIRADESSGARFPVFVNFSAFAQDTWQARRGLTVTYGLRWELNPPPTEARGNLPFAVKGFDDPSTLELAPRGTPLWKTTFDNFAPRAAVAFQPSRRSGTLLRAGVGVFYDLGTGRAGQSFGDTPPYASTSFIFGVPLPLHEPSADGVPAPPDTPYGTLFVSSPKLKLPLTIQWSASVEQPFGDRQLLSASLVGAAGRRLLRGSLLEEPNERFTLLHVTENGARSDYRALQIQFQRRLAKGLQGHAAYTLARSTDDASNDSSYTLLAGSDLEAEYAPSDFDVRQSVSFGFSYDVPPLVGRRSFGKHLFKSWSIDAIFRARTAAPVNVLLTDEERFDGFTNATRPDLVPGAALYLADPGVAGGRRLNRAAFSPARGSQGTLARNSLRGFPVSQLDLALRRHIALSQNLKLTLRAEVYNALNHPNFGDPVTSLERGLFGEATQMLGRSLGTGGINGGLTPVYQIGGARCVQLAVRLQF